MSEDALTALRNAIKSKTTIKLLKDGQEEPNFLAATDIRLSQSVTLAKSTPSRLRKPGTDSDDPQAKPDDFIALGAVYLAWVLKSATAADYMKQLRENGVSLAFVPITDRKAVVEWLEGKRGELPNAAPLTGL
jgi:parafibromin